MVALPVQVQELPQWVSLWGLHVFQSLVGALLQELELPTFCGETSSIIIYQQIRIISKHENI